MKDLIFIGGAKGVGKSTVLEYLKKHVQIEVVNTGDLFTKSKQNGLNPEEAIKAYLIDVHNGMVDTHYAGGYSVGKFSRGLSRENLLRIASVKSIDLILFDLDKKTLFKRRCGNKEEKYQDVNLIDLELKKSREYFRQYCEDLLISGLVIDNIDLDRTMELVLGRIYE
ncbi:MAG: AAA family ATPase [Nanoarchaeota archaeon]|nr:AAA family ATPase [Nanoarchaeota archaeon]